MGKRGKRRKRFFTTNRTKRSAAKLAQQAALVKNSEELLPSKDEEEIDPGNEQTILQLDSQADNIVGYSPDGEDYGNQNTIIVQQVIPGNLEGTVSSGGGVNKTIPSSIQYSLGPTQNSNTKPTNSRIVYITPKRVLEQEDQISFSQANKRIKFEAPTGVEIMSSINLQQNQFTHPPSGLQNSRSDAIFINVSQPSSVSCTTVPSSTSALGSVFLHSNSSNVVHFPPQVPNQSIGQFTNASSLVTAEFSEEREVQLHIEDDDAVNLSEHFSILEEMEAGSNQIVVNDMSHPTKPPSVQPIAIVTGSQIPSINNGAPFPISTSQFSSTSGILKILPDGTATTSLIPSGSIASVVTRQVTPTANVSVFAPNICTAPPSGVSIDNSLSLPNEVTPIAVSGDMTRSQKMVLATPIVSRRPSMQPIPMGPGIASIALTSDSVSLPSNILIKTAISDNMNCVNSNLPSSSLSSLSTSLSSPSSMQGYSILGSSCSQNSSTMIGVAQGTMANGVQNPDAQALIQTPKLLAYTSSTDANRGNFMAIRNSVCNNSAVVSPRTFVKMTKPSAINSSAVLPSPINPDINISSALITPMSTVITSTAPAPAVLISKSIHQNSEKIVQSPNVMRSPASTASSKETGIISSRAPVLLRQDHVAGEDAFIEHVDNSPKDCTDMISDNSVNNSKISTRLVSLPKIDPDGTPENQLKSHLVNNFGLNCLEVDNSVSSTTKPKNTNVLDLVRVPNGSEEVVTIDGNLDEQQELLASDGQLQSVAPLLDNFMEEAPAADDNGHDHLEEAVDEDAEENESKLTKSAFRQLRIKTEDEGDNTEFDMRSLQRRRRIAFTPRQYKLLQTTFEHNNFPEPAEQRSIAQQLGAPYRSIKMWFQNKRAAVRKRLGPETPRAAGSPRTKYKNASDSNSCFYCDLCPAAFIARPFLKRHKEYHQMNTYLCNTCNTGFTHPDLLVTHMKARCKGTHDIVAEESEIEFDGQVRQGLGDSDYNDRIGLPTPPSSSITPQNLTSSKYSSGSSTPLNCSSKPDESGVAYNNNVVSRTTSLPTVLNVPNPQSSILSSLAAQPLAQNGDVHFSSVIAQPVMAQTPIVLTNNVDTIVAKKEQPGDLSYHENSFSSEENSNGLSFQQLPFVNKKEQFNVLRSSEQAEDDEENQPIDLQKRSSFSNQNLDSISVDCTDDKQLTDNDVSSSIQETVERNNENPRDRQSIRVIDSLNDNILNSKLQDTVNGTDSSEQNQSGSADSSANNFLSKVAELTKILGDNINPDVRNQLIQQIFFNHIKQQQKEHQSQVIHKLTEYYTHQLQEFQRTNSSQSDSLNKNDNDNPDHLAAKLQEVRNDNPCIKKEKLSESEDANQLNYGNLTIFSLKGKPKIEPSLIQPIDLSSRSNDRKSRQESCDDSKDCSDQDNLENVSPGSTFQQNLLQILTQNSGSSGKFLGSSGDGNWKLESEQRDAESENDASNNNAAMLPFLLNMISSQNQGPPNMINIIKILRNASTLTSQPDPPTPAALSSLLQGIYANSESNGSENATSTPSFKEHLFNYLINHIIKKNSNADNSSAETPRNSNETEENSTGGKNSTGRPQRRRTTVFSETQHRILYQHFTHCNFPEPAMFRILAKLIGLEAAVIKIWFQNERSRQRKRANFMLEGNKTFTDKPYKCMDCDMSFAMATFLVKHSARHSLQEQTQTKTRVCPICTLKFENDAYNSHLKSVHQVDMALEDVKNMDEKEENENLTCYLCQGNFEDQESLFLHKRNHLSDNYGSVASCSICDSSFVNAICLEAHMQTHYKLDWSFECQTCRSRFPEEILLKSHSMSHGIPAPAISSVNRYRSQTQESHKRVAPPSQPPYKNKNIEVASPPTSLLEAQLRSGNTNVEPAPTGVPIQLPIQISTSQVTTTQVGTPLAVKTTDSSGRNFIQLLPVQLIPVNATSVPGNAEESIKKEVFSASDDKKDSTSRNFVKPKCKKKLPDLIPISQCANLQFPLLNEEKQEKAETPNTPTSLQFDKESPHLDVLKRAIKSEIISNDISESLSSSLFSKPENSLRNNMVGTVHVKSDQQLTVQRPLPSPEDNKGTTDYNFSENSMLYNLLSEKLQSKNQLSLHSTKVESRETAVESDEEPHTLKSEDSDGTASDDELVIDEGAGYESEDDSTRLREDIPATNRINMEPFQGLNLGGLESNSILKQKLLQVLQNAVRSNQEVQAEDQNCSLQEEADGNEASTSKTDDQFEFKKFRNRREYTQEEQLILLTHFQYNHFPPTRELKLIARRLNITHRQIMHWFQNRRSKERKSLPYSRRVSKQCPDCKATFVHDEGLDVHRSISHNPGSIGVQFGCPVQSCLMSFPSEVLLQTHELLHEKKPETSFLPSAKRMTFEADSSGAAKKARRILPKNGDPMRDQTSPDTNSLPSPPSMSSFLTLKSPLLSLPPLEPLAPPPTIDSFIKSSPPSFVKSPHSQSTSSLDSISHSNDSGVSVSSSDSPLQSPPLAATSSSFVSMASPSRGIISPVTHIINKLQLDIKEPNHCATINRISRRSSSGTEATAAPPTLPLSAAQLSQLCLHFEENHLPSPQEMSDLSEQFVVDGSSLNKWFQAKRFSLQDSVPPAPADLPEHSCPMCSAAFVTKPALQHHIRLHSDGNAFTCEVCMAVFRHKVVYETHAKKHLSAAPQATPLTTAALLSPTHSGDSSLLSGDENLTAKNHKFPKNSFDHGPNAPKGEKMRRKTSTDEKRTKHEGSLKDESFDVTKKSQCASSPDNLICRRSSTGNLIISKLGKGQRSSSLSDSPSSSKINKLNIVIGGKSVTDSNLPTTSDSYNTSSEATKLQSQPLKSSLNGSLSEAAASSISAASSIASSIAAASSIASSIGSSIAKSKPVFKTVAAVSFSTHAVNHSSGSSNGSLTSTPSIQKSSGSPLLVAGLSKKEYFKTAYKPSENSVLPLTSSQNKILEVHYEHNNVPKELDLKLLAKHLQVTTFKVVRWFSERRRLDCKKLNWKFTRIMCSKCPNIFISHDKMTRHNLLAHDEALEDERTLYYCDKCSVSFCHKILLETHQFSHGMKALRGKTKKKKAANKKKKKKLMSSLSKPAPKIVNVEDDTNIMIESEIFSDNSPHVTNISHQTDDNCVNYTIDLRQRAKINDGTESKEMEVLNDQEHTKAINKEEIQVSSATVVEACEKTPKTLCTDDKIGELSSKTDNTNSIQLKTVDQQGIGSQNSLPQISVEMKSNSDKYNGACLEPVEKCVDKMECSNSDEKISVIKSESFDSSTESTEFDSSKGAHDSKTTTEYMSEEK